MNNVSRRVMNLTVRGNGRRKRFKKTWHQRSNEDINGCGGCPGYGPGVRKRVEIRRTWPTLENREKAPKASNVSTIRYLGEGRLIRASKVWWASTVLKNTALL